MTRKRIALAALLLGLLGLAGATPTAGEPAKDKVTLKTMTYAELGKFVRTLKGKVVVVDFWADT
jgi:hypothetical protein